jgi:uncharacterized membrane protein
MGTMKRTCILPLVGLVFLGGHARADVSFEIICLGYATDVSADGAVVVGNTQGDFETFRWTEETGRVLLGRPTVPVLGSGAGAPDVSADGTRISATILGADSTYGTQGRWTEGLGWQETMPPPPPDGGLLGDFYGSAWGLSDDGETLTGLYWRPNQPGGSAHASAWTKNTGVGDLGAEFGNSRANDANEDGSVIVGWDEASFGNWRPTVWVNGNKTILSEHDAWCEASTVTPDGTLIGGNSYDETSTLRVAALWRWNGSSWDEELLGSLPGNHPNFGIAICNDMTPDGRVVVGYNRFSNPSLATGFIWTEQSGMVDVEDFLTERGVALDPTFNILSVSGISHDGATMVGSGEDMFPPFSARSFVIRLDHPVGAPAVETSTVTAQLRLFPNPTRAATTFSFDLPRRAPVDLEVYDSSGRLVRRLLRGLLPAGHHGARWDGRDAAGQRVAAGVYFSRLRAGAHHETRRLVIVR